MSTEKRVNFKGEDGGINRLMDEYKRKAESLYSQMKGDAEGLNVSLRKQVEYLNQALEKLDKQNNLIRQRLTTQAKSDFNEESFSAKNPQEREAAFQGYETTMTQARYMQEENDSVKELLKQFIDQQQKQQQDEFVDDATGKNGFAKENKALEGECCKSLEKWLMQIAGNTAMLNHRGNNTGTGLNANNNDSEVEEQDKQDKKESGFFADMMKADITRNLFRNISSMANVQDENEGIGKLFGLGVQASGTMASGAAGGLLSLIPGLDIGSTTAAIGTKMSEMFGDMAGSAKGRELESRKNYEISMNKLLASTGLETSSDLSDFGMNRSESASLQLQLLTATRNKDLAGTEALIPSIERGFGVDRGTMMSAAEVSRFSGDSFAQIPMDMYGAMRKTGQLDTENMLPFQEALQFQLQLMQMKGQTLDNVSSSDSAGAVAMMKSLGGSFGDQRGLERMGSVDNALSSPSNDYQKARSFAALSELNPNQSYFQSLESQSKGLLEEGYLGKMLKQLEGEVGGGENLMLAAHSSLGLSPTASRTLVEGFEKDKTRFDKFSGSTEDLEKEFGGEFKQRASQGSSTFITSVEQSTAKIADAFLKSWHDGLVESFVYSGDKLASELKREMDLILGKNRGIDYGIK